jgi:hypothetical protein
MDALLSVPIVTRCWLIAVVATSVAVHFHYVELSDVAWNFELVYYHSQWWRPITAFLFVGELNMSLLINLHFLLQNTRSYELSPVPTGGSATAAFAWQLICGCVALCVGAAYLLRPFVGLELARYVQTLWCCQRPDAPVSLFGFEMSAKYLPFASAGFSAVVQGGGVDVADFLGALTGFAFFHLFSHPQNPLKTPSWWSAFIDPAFMVGDDVLIGNLAPASEYNGLRATVKMPLADGRYQVQIDGVEHPLSVRATSLTRL